MNDKKYTRFPFLPLSYGLKYMAVPRELIIDYVEGDLYIKSKDGSSEMHIASHRSIKHITDYNNPHKITKDKIGLGEVINVKQTSEEDFLKHLQDDNPHNITKTTIGLDKVRNYDVATVQDVIDARPDKYITPEILAKAVDEFGINIGKEFIVFFDVTPEEGIVKIKIDGLEVLGNTHVVTTGSYGYTVELDGYRKIEEVARISSDTTIKIDLEKIKYKLDFIVDPMDSKVEVKVDGEWMEVDLI